MSLIEAQQAFMAEVAADDDLPPSSLGMAIYRNAYRARLMQALEVSFERTLGRVGQASFEAAAAHYILSFPPHSWTLDAFGDHFPAVLAELFVNEPEVAELAWLEWQMQRAFAAPDLAELTPAELGSAGLGEDDWAGLRLAMAAGFTSREVRHDLAAIWRGAEGSCPLDTPHRLIVWRQGHQPHFRLLEADEWAVLAMLANGASFGEAAALAADPAQLGGWFGQWLGEGLFSTYALSPLSH